MNGEAEKVVQAGAVPILIGALTDPYEWVRSSSAWALSALAEKGQAQYLVKTGVIQPLITGLKDSDNLVRGCSARALDKIAYAGFANDLVTFNVVPPLVQNLEDYYDNVRKKSIWALWSIAVKGKTDIFGQDRVLKPLIKYVLDTDVDVRSGSLHLLGVLGRKGLSERIIIAGITSPLIKSLSSRSRRVRGAAAWALGEIAQGMTRDEIIQSGAITELEKISDNSNKILIFDETHSSWMNKSIHEIVEDTFSILKRKISSNKSYEHVFPDLLSPLYSKTSDIGGGGFAQIFKAERKDGIYVAVKIPILMNSLTGKTFISEIQNWTKLSHPNIVKVYDFNILPIPYFEMELCDGALADQTKPIENEGASRILFNICEGLKFAHAQKIIHRDLKPLNILLKNGVPKISDWGLSRIISESTTTTATSFTIYYAAPEQINNRVKDERTDIWQTRSNSLRARHWRIAVSR